MALSMLSELVLDGDCSSVATSIEAMTVRRMSRLRAALREWDT